MEWTNQDTALALQGIGAFADAWGSYETDKQKNKLLKEQFDYEKQKDMTYNAKMDSAQQNLEDAFSSSSLAPKKKKNPDGTDVVDTTTV